MKTRSFFEQLQYEDRRDAYEKKRLADAAWQAVVDKIKTATPQQLRAAAALKDHDGELGFVGRAAEAEFKRRGL